METLIKQYYQGMEGVNASEMLNNHISYLDDRDSINEDEYSCKYCTDHCYLSMITCTEHSLIDNQAKKLDKKENQSKYEKRQEKLEEATDSQQFCIAHQNYCQCPIPNY